MAQETEQKKQHPQEIPEGATVELELLAEGLTHPTGFEVPSDETDRRFILDQTGQIYVHDGDGLRNEPFLDLSERIVDLGVPSLGGYDERGLLGLAFHPKFQENGRFFVRYSVPVREGTPDEYDHTELLSEFQASDDLSRGDPDSERILMEFPSPQMNHNGGQIAFGPEDGYLYVTMGDGGGANDVGLGHVDDWFGGNNGGNGQDVTQNLLGSIHRIDVDSRQGDKPYGIPSDNPLVGTEGLDEHYAWGFRNPWRMSFNDGDLFVGDLGQNLFEEVDIVEKGGNYGWNVREGTHGFDADHAIVPEEGRPERTPDDVRGGEPLLDPIIEYEHGGATKTVIDGNSVIGGYRYGTLPDGTVDGDLSMEPLRGAYIFGNWSSQGYIEPRGDILAARPPDDGDGLWSMKQLQFSGRENGELGEFVLSFGRDNDGELYVLTTEEPNPEGSTGKVYKFSGVQQTADDGETNK